MNTRLQWQWWVWVRENPYVRARDDVAHAGVDSRVRGWRARCLNGEIMASQRDWESRPTNFQLPCGDRHSYSQIQSARKVDPLSFLSCGSWQPSPFPIPALESRHEKFQLSRSFLFLFLTTFLSFPFLFFSFRSFFLSLFVAVFLFLFAPLVLFFWLLFFVSLGCLAPFDLAVHSPFPYCSSLHRQENVTVCNLKRKLSRDLTCSNFYTGAGPGTGGLMGLLSAVHMKSRTSAPKLSLSTTLVWLEFCFLQILGYIDLYKCFIASLTRCVFCCPMVYPHCFGTFWCCVFRSLALLEVEPHITVWCSHNYLVFTTISAVCMLDLFSHTT
jgi:hypothetical protein